MNIFWVRGDQLFEQTIKFAQALESDDQWVFWFIESPQFVDRYNYHKQKLQFMFSAMRAFADRLRLVLKDRKMQVVVYQDLSEGLDVRAGLERLQTENYLTNDTKLRYYTPANADSDIEEILSEYKLTPIKQKNPAFFSIAENIQKHVSDKKKYYFENFYRDQRRSTGYLIDGQGEPIGGNWNFDSKNRKKLPKNVSIPDSYQWSSDLSNREYEIFTEVKDYISRYYGHNPGEIAVEPNYAFTHKSACSKLFQFLETRLKHFGDYEDAISSKDDTQLFHSVLSPLINIGLLTPKQVVETAIDYWHEHQDTISINQIEGFVRQILGWREYIKAIYDKIGGIQLSKNFFKHTRKLPEVFYNGSTKIAPIDKVIQNINRTGYSHHIERLMILGNFMLLCEIDPQDVYFWFMEMFVDAYEWVMVPNIMGMSQFADGGEMMTKPYISGSNYVLKMSDYTKKSAEKLELEAQQGGIVETDWTEIWDSLFWEFLHKHEQFFKTNGRMGFLVSTYHKKTADQRKRYQQIKSAYMLYLDHK